MKLNVCERIDQILSERKMSRRQLAFKAGIPPSTLQSALARKKNMSVEMIQLIANALGISVNELLGIRPIPKWTLQFDDGSVEGYSEIVECLAFERYLRDLGYHVYSVTKEDLTSLLVMYDEREDIFYCMELERFNILEGNVDAFIKFQMCELIRHLEKITDPKLKEYCKQTLEEMKKGK